MPVFLRYLSNSICFKSVFYMQLSELSTTSGYASQNMVKAETHFHNWVPGMRQNSNIRNHGLRPRHDMYRHEGRGLECIWTELRK